MSSRVQIAPERLSEYDDQVLIGYHQFELREMDTARILRLQVPATLMTAGEGGACFLSAADAHIVTVHLEVWSAQPDSNSTRQWDLTEEATARFETTNLVFEGVTTSLGKARIKLPAIGAYRIRAHVMGRQAARDAEGGDLSRAYPTGLERWLIQLWPAQV